MKHFHRYTLVTIVSLLSVMPAAYGQLPVAAIHGQQSNCIDQIVQDAEVLAHKQLDVNHDGIQDDVVVYGQDELYVLVAINQPALNCKVILNDALTSRQVYAGTRRPVTVKQIELVDLTGDNQPELHIGLEGTYFFRESGAFHAVYKLQGEDMKRIFVSDQCLPMSTFEFRTAPDGAELIYVDEDLRCVPPSSRRDYAIYRWNAENSQFEQIESGQVAKTSPDPLWDALISIYIMPVAVVAGVVMLGLVAWLVSKRKSAKANTK